MWPDRAAALGVVGRIEPPRSQAMGGAGTALEYDASLVWLNPSAIARLREPALTLAGQTGFAGGVTGSGSLVKPFAGGSAGAGVLFSDAGLATLNASDGTAREVSAGRDLLLVATVAAPLAPALAAGCSIKWLRSELVEEFRASGVAFDGGVQIQFTPDLKTALSVKNLGPGVRYDEDRVGLPSLVKVGAAYGATIASLLPLGSDVPDQFVVATDGEYQLAGRRLFWRGGVEYWWHRVLAARLGSLRGTANTLGSLAVGGGLRLDRGEGTGVRQYRLDYSFKLRNEAFDLPQSVSLTLIF